MKKSKFGTMEEPKAAQLQKATHQEILSVGQQVFQNEMDTKENQFADILRQREQEVLTICEQEKQEALQMLREEQAINIKKVKEDAIKLQDAALKSEAKRVEAIMKKIATQLVEEKMLEGQRKLEEALFRARENFDIEKEETVQLTIRQQEKIALIAKEAEDEIHRKHIKRVNSEWKLKIEEALQKLRVQMDGEMCVALREQREANEAQRVIEIAALQRRHADEIAEWNARVNEQMERNAELRDEITAAAEQHKQMEDRIVQVLEAFQNFVDSVPGFSGEDGQSDFLLHGLIPDLSHLGISTRKCDM